MLDVTVQLSVPGPTEVLFVDAHAEPDTSPRRAPEYRHIFVTNFLHHCDRFDMIGSFPNKFPSCLGNRALDHDPSTLIFRGMLADKQGKSDQAIDFFANAKSVSAPADSNSKSLSDLFSAAILLRQGKREAAVEHLYKVQKIIDVQRDPQLIPFIEHEFGAVDFHTTTDYVVGHPREPQHQIPGL